MTEKEMRALLDRWNRAFAHLAPGSEFIDDPERTAKQVKGIMETREAFAYNRGYQEAEMDAIEDEE